MSSSSDLPPIADRVFYIDVEAESSVGMLRLIGAVAVLFATIAMVAASPGFFGWVIVVLAWIACAAWFVSFKNSRTRVQKRDEYFLKLSQEGVTLSEGAHRTTVLWSALRDVSVDENRLVVVLQVEGREPVAIEPRFRDVAIDDLARTIKKYWATS